MSNVSAGNEIVALSRLFPLRQVIFDIPDKASLFMDLPLIRAGAPVADGPPKVQSGFLGAPSVARDMQKILTVRE